MGNDSYALTNMNIKSIPLETAGARTAEDHFLYFDTSLGQFRRAIVPADTRIVSLTGTASITKRNHANRTMYITGTAAATYTLPEATGTGDVYTFIIGQVNTNGTVIQAADTTNTSFRGTCELLDLDGASQNAYATATAGGTDTVTMNGTTTGGRIGDKFVFVDVATDVWHVHGYGSVPAGSDPATPFSSAA